MKEICFSCHIGWMGGKVAVTKQGNLPAMKLSVEHGTHRLVQDVNSYMCFTSLNFVVCLKVTFLHFCPDHILRVLLPPPAQLNYNFRKRQRNRQFPDRISRLTDCNFTTRMLYRDAY